MEKILKVTNANNRNYLLVNFGDGELTVTLVDQNLSDRRVKVLGMESVFTKELKDGFIKNMEEVQSLLMDMISSLKEETNNPALRGEKVQVVCTISSSLGERVNSQGEMNFASNEIDEDSVERLIQLALYNNNMPNDVMVLNYSATDFKVDGISISNPINMSGRRLEVELEIQTVERNHFNNFKKVIEGCGLEISYIQFDTDNLIDVILEDEDKNHGVVLLEFGTENSKMVFVKEGKIVKTLKVQMAAKNVIGRIAEEYSLKFDEVYKLYKNLDLIFSYSGTKGYFEIERPSGEIMTIRLDHLRQVIGEELRKTFMQLRHSLNSNLGGIKYKNGVVFINRSGFKENVSKVVSSTFAKDVITIVNEEEIINNNKMVKKSDLLENKFDILGDIGFLTKKSRYQYDFKNLRYPKPNTSSVQKIGKTDLEHLKEFRPEKKEEGKTKKFYKKAAKILKELW